MAARHVLKGQCSCPTLESTHWPSSHLEKLKCLMASGLLVGVLGIERSVNEPEWCVLPVYDTP